MAKKINSIDNNLDQSNLVNFDFSNYPENPIGNINQKSNFAELQLGEGFGEYSRDIDMDWAAQSISPEDLNQKRADAQTGIELFGKALAQGATEATLGAIEGVGYALDFEDLFNTEDMASRDFDNWFSKSIRDAKEHVQEEWFPIYQSDVAKHGTFSQKLGDPTWWASQGKTAGVTMSMLIPALGVAGQASKIASGTRYAKLLKSGMAAKEAAKIAQTTGQTIGGFVAGLTSAKIEATMEASQKFEEDLEYWKNDENLQKAVLDKYEQQIKSIDSEIEKLSGTLYNPTNEDYALLEAQRQEQLSSLMQQRELAKVSFDKDLEIQARERAGLAASHVYRANAVKAPLEVAQFMMATKTFSSLKKGVDAAKASKLGKVAGVAFQPTSEAGEELYQGYASQRATEAVKKGEPFLKEDLISGIADYATTEEGKEAAFLGGLMGIVFEYGGRGVRKGFDAIKKTPEEIAKKDHLTREGAENLGRYANANHLMASYDNLSKDPESLNKFESMFNEDIDSKINKEDISEEDKASFEEIKSKINDDVKYVKEQDDILSSDERYADPVVRSEYVKSKLFDKVYQDEVSKLDNLVESEVSNSGLSGAEETLFAAKFSKQQLKSARNEVFKDKSLTKEEREVATKYVDKQIEMFDSAYISTLESIKQENPDYKISEVTPRNSEQLNKYIKEQNVAKINKKISEHRVNKFANLSKEKAEQVSNEVTSKDNQEKQKLYEQRLRESNTSAEVEVLEKNMREQDPDVYKNLSKKIAAKKSQLNIDKEKSKIDNKQSNNFNTFNNNVINKAETKEDLAKAKNTLNNTDKVFVSPEQKKQLNNLIDKRITELPQETISAEKSVGDFTIPKVGKYKGQEGIIEKKTPKGYKVKFDDGKSVFFTNSNLEEQKQTKLFDDEGNLAEDDFKDALQFTEGLPDDFEGVEDIEAKKADIERRRQEELKQKGLFGIKENPFPADEDVVKTNNINAKYDAELASLETQAIETLEDSELITPTTSEKAVSEYKEPTVDTSTPIIDENTQDKIDESESKIDGSGKQKLYQTVPNILLTTLAKESKKVTVGKETFTVDDYKNGKVVKTELYDPAIANEESFKPGSEIVLFVNKDNLKHVSGKLTSENLPISIMNVEKFNEGKTPFMSVRDLTNESWKDMDETALNKTKELRNKIFEAYKKNKTSKFYTKVLTKDWGWTTKTKQSDSLKRNLFINDDVKYGDQLSIGMSDNSGGVKIGSDYAVNKEVPTGIPHLIYKNAIGNLVGNQLIVEELSENNPELYKSYVDNVFSIIESYANKDDRFTFNNIYSELSKYFHTRRDVGKHFSDRVNSKDDSLNNNVFGIDRFNDDINIYLPNKKGYKTVVISLNNGELRYYNLVNGEKVLTSRDSIYNQFLSRLDQMYPNIIESASENIDNFKRFNLVDGKLEEVLENYFDFLSNAGVKTRLQPLIGSDGIPYYVTQPNITIDNNIKTESENNEVKSEPKEVDESSYTKPEETNANANVEVVEAQKPTRNRSRKIDYDDTDIAPVDKAEDMPLKNDVNKIDYNSSTLSSFNNINSIDVENNILSSLLVDLLDILDIQREEGKNVHIPSAIQEVFNEVTEEIEFFEKHSDTKTFNKEEALNDFVTPYPSKNKEIAGYLKTIKENFNETKNEDGSVKFIGYAKKLNLMYNQLSYNAIHELREDETEEGAIETERFIEGKNYKADPEKSMSAQIRRLLSNIISVTPDGKKRINKIGQYTYENPGLVFNYLMENLHNIDTKDIINELNDLSKGNYIALGVSEKLNKLLDKNQDVVNKFITVFKKQQAKFNTLKHNKKVVKDKKTGEIQKTTTIGKVIESNRSGAKDIIFNNWNSQFANQGFKSGLLSETDGELIIDRKIADDLRKDFYNKTKSVENRNDLKELSKTFEKIGISVSVDALEKLKKDYYNKEYKKYFKAEFGNSSKTPTFEGFLRNYFGYIYSNMKDGLNPFKTQTKTIKSLAVYEQKFDIDASSQSFRNGNGDMIYSFVNPHHLSNSIDRLKNDEDFRSKLSNDKFASKSTWLEESNEIAQEYFDSAKADKKGSFAKEYQDQNDYEKEVTKINLFGNGGKAKSLFFTSSPSDKTTFSLIKAPRLEVENNLFKDNILTLNQELENKLFDVLVMSEVDRINQTVADFNKNKESGTLNKLLNGYHYHKGNLGLGAVFTMIPFLNEVASRSEDGSVLISATEFDILREEMRNFLENEIKNKIEKWNNLDLKGDIDSDTLNSRDGSIESLATDFVINNAVSYANQFMIFTGDPAKFAKIPKSVNNVLENYQEALTLTINKMFKRIAKDIAPGVEGNFEKQDYKVAFIEEPKENSLLGKEISNYLGIELADAQEWTTLEEHVNVMYAYGKLTNEEKQAILDNKNNLTWDQIGKVMQPMKPVQVMSELSPNFGAFNEIYIKSSSFPLLPQLTQGFPELDKLRKFMEDNSVDRLAPKTAVKLGYTNSVSLFDGSIFNEENRFTSENILTLNRSGFRIQQEVPYDPNKESILAGSQLRKLMHADLGVDGKEYKDLADSIYSEMYDRKYNKIKKKLDVDDQGRINNIDDLKDLMVEEAIDRDYGLNEILMLNTMKLKNGNSVFKIPMFFHPMVHKLESLLNSVVKNKMLKMKLPGKSYVQGSALGFSVKTEEFLNRVSPDKNGVILTKDYKGSLDYRKENGILYSDIFLPSFFKRVDLKQFIGVDGLLDTSKIDSKLLEAIGYRIPTQGFSSIIKLKVVGILPEVAGDLIIVPGAMAVQMGSDFDVDKLYVHRYNPIMNEDGSIDLSNNKIKFDNTSDDIKLMSDEQLQNKLLETYHAILEDPKVQKKSKQPLDNDKIQKLVEGPFKDRYTQTNQSVISDDLHTDMIDVQAAGKIGIGITSLASTWHALQQYSGLYIKPDFRNKENPRYLSVMFSKTNDKEDISKFSDNNELDESIDKNDVKLYSPKGNTGNLDVKYGHHAYSGAFRLDKINGFTNRPIIDVITNIQTESVDNANNGRLYGMNLNRQTFNVATLIAETGFDEEMIGYFLNQPVIIEYVKRLNSLNNYTETEYTKGKRELMKQNFLIEIGVKENLDNLIPENVSLEDMIDGIKSSDIKTDLQRTVLKNFMIYQEIAEDLQKVRTLYNVDTKYLGKSFSSVVDKFNKNQNFKEKFIGNTSGLTDGTVAGKAFTNGVGKTMQLFGTQNLLPYNSKSIIEIYKNISEITDRELNESDIEEISIEIRSALWNSILMDKYGIDNIDEYRKSLVYSENTLASRILKAKSKLKNNSFIQSLNPVESFEKEVPSTVEHYSSKDSKADYDLDKQKGWLQLMKSPFGSYEHKLGVDLMIYSITFGTERTAKDFGRYLPYDTIVNEGLDKMLRNIDFNSSTNKNIVLLNDNFVKQYFQHNPNKLPELSTQEDLDVDEKSKYAKEFNEKTRQVEMFELIDDQYFKVDRLGHDFMTEYNLNSSFAKTIVEYNPKGINIQSENISSRSLEDLNDIENGIFIMNDYGFDKNIESVLNRISDKNSEYSELSRYFLENIEKVSNYKLEKYNPESPIHRPNDELAYEVTGRLITKSSGGGILTLYPKAIVDSNKFEEAFLHEVSHIFTRNQVEYLFENNSLSESELGIKNGISSVFDEFKKNVAKDNLEETFQNALNNEKEFVVESLTNIELQNYLNKKDVKRKSLLNSLLELINKLFTNVREGSLLESTLHEVMKLQEVSTESLAGNTLDMPIYKLKEKHLQRKQECS